MNFCNTNITTNAGGIPYISSTNVTVGTETVDIALGFRRIQPVGYITVFIEDVIPTDTTTTLPVTLTLNGTTRALTLPNGTPVTAAELIGVNVIQVFNDRFRGILTLMSRTIA
ncbi:MAG: hypothetical protein IJU02_07210 [Lachnospiraceae bacterium]|nr:hypothetical protein [Lachnospiraceae bacterium]